MKKSKIDNIKSLTLEIFNLLQEINGNEISDNAFTNITRAKARCVSIIDPDYEIGMSETWEQISKNINRKIKS